MSEIISVIMSEIISVIMSEITSEIGKKTVTKTLQVY